MKLYDEERAAILAGMNTTRRVIVTVEGGIVGSVYADDGGPLDVSVLDYDDMEATDDPEDLEPFKELEAAIGQMTAVY